MRKWLGAIVIIALVVLVLCLLPPYVLGYVVESQYKQFLQNVPLGKQATLKLVDYERGWFKSQATLEVTFTSPTARLKKTEGKVSTLTISQSVEHGPVIFDAEGMHFVRAIMASKVAYSSSQMEAFKKYDNAPPDISVRTVFPMMGGVVAHERCLPFTYRDENNSLDFKGFTADIVLSSNAKHLMSTVHFDGMECKVNKAAMQVGKIKMQSKADKDASGLWIGRKEVSLESMRYAVSGDKSLVVVGSGAQFTMDQQERDGVIDAIMRMHLDKLMVDNQTYAPSSMEVHTSNVSAAALAAFRKELQEGLPQGKVMDKTAMMQKLMQRQQLVVNVLNGVGVEIPNLNFTTPNGVVKAQIKMQYPKLESPTATALASGTTMEALFTLPHDLVLHVLEQYYQYNKPVEQAQPDKKAPKVPDAKTLAKQRLEQCVSDGWFIPAENNSYKVEIHFEGKKLTINQKPLQPTVAVQPQMQKPPLPQKRSS